MRALDPALQTLLCARRGFSVDLLLWIVARHRVTGLPVTQGLASSIEDLTVTIDGTPRAYANAGGKLSADAVVSDTGMSGRMQTVRLSGTAAEVDAIMRAADPRLAPAEVHRIVRDPVTGLGIGAPQLLFGGTIDAAPVRTPKRAAPCRSR